MRGFASRADDGKLLIRRRFRSLFEAGIDLDYADDLPRDMERQKRKLSRAAIRYVRELVAVYGTQAVIGLGGEDPSLFDPEE